MGACQQVDGQSAHVETGPGAKTDPDDDDHNMFNGQQPNHLSVVQAQGPNKVRLYAATIGKQNEAGDVAGGCDEAGDTQRQQRHRLPSSRDQRIQPGRFRQ